MQAERHCLECEQIRTVSYRIAPNATRFSTLTIEAIAHDSGVSKATTTDGGTARLPSSSMQLSVSTCAIPLFATTCRSPKLCVRMCHRLSISTRASTGRPWRNSSQEASTAHRHCRSSTTASGTIAEPLCTSSFQRRIVEGAVRTDIEPALIGCIVHASRYQRLLFRDGPLDARFADQIVTLAWADWPASRSAPPLRGLPGRPKPVVTQRLWRCRSLRHAVSNWVNECDTSRSVSCYPRHDRAARTSRRRLGGHHPHGMQCHLRRMTDRLLFVTSSGRRCSTAAISGRRLVKDR